MNTKEDTKLRIASVVIAMETSPPLAVYHLMAHKIETEPNRQLASYVYSAFKTIARNELPCYRAV